MIYRMQAVYRMQAA